MSEPEQTFEQAQAELEQIVTRLEQGQASLDEAIALWERGEQLMRSAAPASTRRRARSKS
jgi:exodeoxyribonuclease VII small subunit